MLKLNIRNKQVFLTCMVLLVSTARVCFMPSKAVAAGSTSASVMMSDTLLSDTEFVEIYTEKLGVPIDTHSYKPLLIHVASWLGTPYRRSGTTRQGTDCSGFVSSLYRDVWNVNLTHSSAGMLYQMKTRVKKAFLQQGDIVFFKIRSSRISHVGIYLGNHKFVHASTVRGVVIDDLRTPYYTRYYYGAGRPS